MVNKRCNFSKMALEEEGHRMGSGRVPRGRGCNESFRAAVDRSYDVPLNGLRNKMETRKFKIFSSLEVIKFYLLCHVL